MYNGEKYLSEAITSILTQSYGDFEFLVINDGSMDRSDEIVLSFSDPRIKLVRNEKNLGLIATLNRGLDLAKCQYIARMDCDDISLPNRFAKQLAFLDANPAVAALGTGYGLIDDEGAFLGAHTHPQRNPELLWSLPFYSPIIHPSVMMRTGVIKDVGGYRNEALYCEDYDLWWRVSRVAQLGNLRDILILLRKHDESVTKTNFMNHVRNSDRVRMAIVSDRLVKEISVESVSTLRTDGVGVEGDLQASELICLLYKSFKTSEHLTRNERRVIRRDAGIRIMNAIRQRYWHPTRLRYLVIAFMFNARYAIKKLARYILSDIQGMPVRRSAKT